MCGIAGFVGIGALSERNAAGKTLSLMAAAMHSRGPDDRRAVWHEATGSGLVATRLAMVDVELGAQPVSNEDATIWGVLNGEIYNHQEERSGLVSKGHAFRAHSDTEVIPHLYEEEGDHLFSRLTGMYSIAVLDTAKRQLLLGRDHAGMKPLFHARVGDGLVFASDVRALFASGLVQPEADWAELGKYFHLGYIPAPGSAFVGIQQVAPGSFLRWSGGVVSIHRHWSPPPLDVEPSDPPAKLEELLVKSVSSHLQGDVEVGSYLSGGWDSSLIAALAKKQGGALKTFSLVMPDAPRLDESKHSRAVATALGTEHFEIEFRTAMLPGLLEESAWHLGEPFSAAPHSLLFLLSKKASSQVKAVVGGEGADELLGGYQWLAPSADYRWRKVFPSALASMFSRMTDVPALQQFFWKMATRSRDELDFEAVRRLDRSLFPAIVSSARGLGNETLGYPSVAHQLGDQAVTAARDHLQRRLLLEYGGRLTGAILPIGDRMSMARGLEIRLPFLDRSVVEFCMRLPSRWKIDARQEKAILRPLIEKHVPAIAHRKKRGLRVSAEMMDTREYLDFVNAVLRSRQSRFSEAEVASALDRRLSVPNLLSSMLHLQLWWDLYIAPGSPAQRLFSEPVSGAEELKMSVI